MERRRSISTFSESITSSRASYTDKGLNTIKKTSRYPRQTKLLTGCYSYMLTISHLFLPTQPTIDDPRIQLTPLPTFRLTHAFPDFFRLFSQDGPSADAFCGFECELGVFEHESGFETIGVSTRWGRGGTKSWNRLWCGIQSDSGL